MYDEYQRGLAPMFYKFFDNQSTNQRETEINPDAVCDKHHVVRQLQRPFIRKLHKLKVTPFGVLILQISN